MSYKIKSFSIDREISDALDIYRQRHPDFNLSQFITEKIKEKIKYDPRIAGNTDYSDAGSHRGNGLRHRDGSGISKTSQA